MSEDFHFPETLSLNGKTFHLVFDPGNPQRAQAVPNYDVMIPLATSVTQEIDLPGVGKKWLAIVDAKSPAQSMRTGTPAIEQTYLCFRIVDGPISPLNVPAREFVVYAEEVRPVQGNRAQGIIDTVLGFAMEGTQQQATNWTKQLSVAKNACKTEGAEDVE